MATETSDCSELECCTEGSFTYEIPGDNTRITEEDELRITESGEQRVIE